jgi:exopolysaccharide biosynthesis protein
MAPGGFTHVWTTSQAPADAALAVNAGQFAADGAWGWVVHDGVEYRAPRTGPLAVTVLVDSGGSVRLLDDSAAAAVRRGTAGAVREAFQSYPALLTGNAEYPAMLSGTGAPLDLAHRDARLALGLDSAGRVVLALTRFDAAGPLLGAIPFGLTVSETASLMRALGCRQAVALDGGISAQLLLRDSAGVTRQWRGLRPVPLGLSATPR